MSAGASAEAADVLAIALEAGLDVRAAIELAGSDSELHLLRSSCAPWNSAWRRGSGRACGAGRRGRHP